LRTAGVQTDMEPVAQMPSVYVDPAQIQQVFVNLFVNALHAMPSGGRLTVKVRHEEHSVLVEIEDTGRGIDTEDLDKIFNPFFTTRSQGTGLGLSIVQRILERHQATIEPFSRTGKGTRFTIRFPLKIEAGSMSKTGIGS
jgi:signal transduction histidine kinase